MMATNAEFGRGNPSRRTALFHVAEAAAVLPLAGIAISSTLQQDKKHTLALEGAELPRRTGDLVTAQVQRLISAATERAQAAARLERQYKADYEKSRTVPSVSVNADGNLTTTLRTEYYYDVPSGLPNQHQIGTIAHRAVGANNGFVKLIENPLIDLNKTGEIAVRAARGDTIAGKILVGLIYAGEIALLLGYEEAIAAFRASNGLSSYRNELESNLTPTQHTRRGFLKLGTAVAGLGSAMWANGAISARLEKGEKLMAEKRDDAIRITDSTDEERIQRELGTTLVELRSTSSEHLQVARNALSHSIRESGVRGAFEEFERAEARFREAIDDISSGEGKAALGYLCLSKTVTDNLRRANSSEGRLAAFRGALEALGVGATMVAFITAGELLNNRFAGSGDPYERGTERY